MKFKRWQEPRVEEALRNNRVVILAGPRQCGKTTTANVLLEKNEGFKFYSLDDAEILAAAKTDPRGFLQRNCKTMIIDEIQRAPELLTAIKKTVDFNSSYGQFLIAGSADIQNLPTVAESLAGRVKKIVLLPLSMGEIRSSRPKFIENAFRGKFDCRGLTKRDALLLALKGGFPESVLFEDVSNSLAWGESYLDAIIDRDLKDVANIRRLDNLKTLLRVLAAWSSKFMDKTGVTSSLSITKPTFDSYFSALKNMFLIDATYPWAKTDYEYASKRAKIFMSDTGLMAAALGWNLSKIELDSDKCGKLIETFVYNQLSAEINAASQKYYLSHYRDSEKREIDFLIENEDNDLLAIEVKSGSAVSKDSFKHIVWFRERMKKRFNRFVGVVLYTGDCLLPFGENLFAAPMDALWNAS